MPSVIFRCLIGLVFTSMLSLLLLQFVLYLSLRLRGHPKYQMRDLLPPVHLEADSPLRNAILWRKDMLCGESHVVSAKAIDGRDVMVPAGCNPHGERPCCTSSQRCMYESFSNCRSAGSINYKTDYRAFDLQLLMLTQIRGPVAHAFNLTGNEWRQDFLCGPGTMVMEWASANKMDMQEAACNPDSPDRYLCDVGLSICTSGHVKGTGENRIVSNGFHKNDSTLLKLGWREDTMTTTPVDHRHHVLRTNRTIDYRRQESWDKRRALLMPVNFDIKQHMVQFKNSAHRFANPYGLVSDTMLIEGFTHRTFRGGETPNSSGSMKMTTPRWFYINMDADPEKATRLEHSLEQGGVLGSDITRISAVTPGDISRMQLCVPGKAGVGAKAELEKAVLLSHLRAIKRAWDHNKARALQGLPPRNALIVEDDLSLELVSMWKIPPSHISLSSTAMKKDATSDIFGSEQKNNKVQAPMYTHSITLHDVFRELDQANRNWEICQLSATCFWPSDCREYIAEMAQRLAEHHLIIQRESLGRHRSLWGAVAYAVSLSGQARILDNHWPGGKNGYAFDDLPQKSTFRIRDSDEAVPDALLFRTTRPNATYFSARPLFCSLGDHSEIHKKHLWNHERSKYLMESVLYLGHDVKLESIKF